ncbi:MAG: EF-hand domain-containing protein [Duganella sp.]
MTIYQVAAAAAATTMLAMAPAISVGAQTAPAEMAAATRPAVSTPYSDAYVPRSMRQPKRDVAPGPAPTLLRFQSLQNLKKRFADADADGSGTLNREEARQAGFTVVDKNFDNIDSAQRGHITFDDLNAYLIQRREEASSR